MKDTAGTNNTFFFFGFSFVFWKACPNTPVQKHEADSLGLRSRGKPPAE